MTNEALIADFDRMLSTLSSLPDAKLTKPRTILDIYPIVHEKNVTFVVQTARQKDEGYAIFLQIVDGAGSRRVVIPAKVAAAIYAQRQALTDRSTPESRARDRKRREREKAKREREARKARRASAG